MASDAVALHRPGVDVDRWGVGLVALAAVLSGLCGVLSRIVLDHGLSGPQLAQLRLMGCAVVLLAVYGRGALAVVRGPVRGLGEVVVLGIVGMAGLQVCYLAALKRLDVALALLLLYLAPVILATLDLVVHRRRQRPYIWACMAAMVVGLAVALGLGPDAAGGVSTAGVLAGLGAAAAWAYYMLHTERLGKRHAGPAFLAVGIAVGAAFLAVVFPVWQLPWGLLDDAVAVGVAGWHPPALLLVIAVVLFGTLAPFVLFLEGLRRIGAGPTSMLATLEPVAAAGAAWVLLSQRLTALQLLGGLAVIVAAAASQRPSGSGSTVPPSGEAAADGEVGEEGAELVRRPG